MAVVEARARVTRSVARPRLGLISEQRTETDPGIVKGSLNKIVTQSLLAKFWAPPELTNTAFGHPPSY